MSESWLDPFVYDDIVKLVKKRCPKAENISVLMSAKASGEKRFDATYTHTWQGKEYHLKMGLTEYGEMLSLDPRGGETFFNIARRKNQGRIINSETFEQAYIRVYTEAIRKQRDEQIKEAKKEKDFEERFNKIYRAEKLYDEMVESVAKFVLRQGIEIKEESEPNC